MCTSQVAPSLWQKDGLHTRNTKAFHARCTGEVVVITAVDFNGGNLGQKFAQVFALISPLRSGLKLRTLGKR